MIDTRESLLDRLKVEGAHDAWREFFHLYWRPILRYARKLGLGEHEAQEILQETMVALMRQLPQFAYDPQRGRFRNFLLTIVHRKALNYLRRESKRSELPWDGKGENRSLDPFGNGDAFAREAKLRWQEALVEEAIRRVRAESKLRDATFAVFEAYVLQRRPAEVVAFEFGLKENAVYQIRNRLLRRVQAEVRKLTIAAGGDWSADEPA